MIYANSIPALAHFFSQFTRAVLLEQIKTQLVLMSVAKIAIFAVLTSKQFENGAILQDNETNCNFHCLSFDFNLK